jgi:signal transduction histidine kinase
MKTSPQYILKGLLLGAVVGVVAGHPVFLAAHNLHEHFAHQAPLRVTRAVLRSFRLSAWPLTLFFAIVGGAVGAVMGRLYHRLEAHRLSYQARLRDLAAEISLAEERERRRLAIELHEQIGQVLAGVLMELSALRPEITSDSGQSALQEARKNIDGSIHYIRSLAGELSPPALYDMGFAGGAAWLARQVRDQYGIEVELQQHPINWPPCDDSQILLFIIVRDLVTAVARQARPQLIKILMQQEENHLRLQVEHDGVAVSDTGGEPPGFALFSIRERLNRIGGTVEVESPPDQGTVIIIRVPLNQDALLS